MFKPLVLTVYLPHSYWSDLDVEEDWNGEKQKEREGKEKELKEKEFNNNSKSLHINLKST